MSIIRIPEHRLALVLALALAGVALALALASAALAASPGDVYLTDSGAPDPAAPGAVLRADPLGAVQGPLVSGPPLVDPAGLAVDVDGGVLVADRSGSVHRIDPLTTARTVFASGAPLVRPSAVAVDPFGEVYIADERAFGGTGGVLRLDPFTGAAVPVASGSPFAEPNGVVVEPDGRLLVSDRRAFGSGAVLRVDPFDGSVTRVASLERPTAVAVSALGTVFVTVEAGRVIRMNPAGGEQRVLAAGPPLVSPQGVGVAAGADLLVSARGALVRVSLATGERVIAPSAVPLRTPRGIAVVGNRDPVADFEMGPNPASPGERVTFDAGAASDPDGPLARFDWDLDGDGQFETRTGPSPVATRVYRTEGEIAVRLRVTDPQGASAETDDVLVVGDFSDGEGLEAEGEGATRDATAPALSSLRVRPRRLLPARRGGRSSRRRGGRLGYRLSEAADVRLSLRRRTGGRRGCRGGSPRRRCTRYRRVRGAIVVRGARGANVARFSGRLSGRRLRTGRYRLVARATDAAGNRSRPVVTALTVVSRRRR